MFKGGPFCISIGSLIPASHFRRLASFVLIGRLFLVLQEVARMPPFQRRTLVLIGAQGVGRRTLKQRLMKADSSRFGAVTPRKLPILILTGLTLLYIFFAARQRSCWKVMLSQAG